MHQLALRLLALFLTVTLLTTAAASQRSTLLKDINSLPNVNPGTHPKGFASLGGAVYFVGRTGNGGQLFRSTGVGGSTTLLTNVARGRHDPGPSGLTSVGRYVMFKQYAPGIGVTVFRADNASTQVVRLGTSVPFGGFAVIGSVACFVAWTSGG